jgi:hypothetical protein
MIYKEENRDLFTVPSDYCLAHCISADFGMGKGIVVEFNKRFDMKNKIIQLCNGDIVKDWDNSEIKGRCIKIDRVFNLITKRNYWGKPTYSTLNEALQDMKVIAIKNNITKIAMPIIGCGLDRLNWEQVSKNIQNIFNDTDIEILVCKV